MNIDTVCYEKNIVKIFLSKSPSTTFLSFRILMIHNGNSAKLLLTEVTWTPFSLPPDSSSVSGQVSNTQLTSRMPENVLHESLEETAMQRGGEEAGSLTSHLPLEPL